MPRIVLVAAAVVLVVHGLIHLMGSAVYMKLAEIEGLRYKTTLLGSRWDLGERGILVFGAFCVLPAIGFVTAALALPAGWDWWHPVLVATTLVSLTLIGLAWSNAFMGGIVNVGILALLWLGPRIGG